MPERHRVAFLLSQFPETHETFILREFVELKRKGLEFTIYSLKPCRDRIVHPEARQLMEHTVYSPLLFNIEILKAQIAFILSNPIRYVTTALIICRYFLKSPVDLFKSLAILPISVYYGRLMQKEGIGYPQKEGVG